MNRVVAKIALFLFVFAVVGAVNNFVISGPLLQHNTEVSMNQFKGVAAPAGDFQIAGYWLTFNTVYIVEVLGMGLLAAVLFIPHILNALFSPKE